MDSVQQSKAAKLSVKRKKGINAYLMRTTFASEMLCIFCRDRRLRAAISDKSTSPEFGREVIGA